MHEDGRSRAETIPLAITLDQAVALRHVSRTSPPLAAKHPPFAIWNKNGLTTHVRPNIKTLAFGKRATVVLLRRWKKLANSPRERMFTRRGSSGGHGCWPAPSLVLFANGKRTNLKKPVPKGNFSRCFVTPGYFTGELTINDDEWPRLDNSNTCARRPPADFPRTFFDAPQQGTPHWKSVSPRYPIATQ